jgi:hypothetical protein
MGDAGVASLADALRVNTALTQIDLNNSAIGDPGAAHFAAALGANSTLARLNLGANPIRDAGVSALAAAVTHNTTVTTLDIGTDELTPAGDAAMEAAVRANPGACAALTPAQRLAFTGGCACFSPLRSAAAGHPLAKLPRDMVRRILTRYRVRQADRGWQLGQLRIAVADRLHGRINKI